MTGIVRCLGCADSLLGLPHRCAGDRELVPYGGYCQCPEAGCGPSAGRTAKPQRRRPRR